MFDPLYTREEKHNRSISGLLTSNQLEMLVSDIIFKKITFKSKDFNVSLNSNNSKSKSKNKKIFMTLLYPKIFVFKND